MADSPATRRLRIFAFDPSLASRLETFAINEVTSEVPWEDLTLGPVGEYLEVVDVDPASGVAYRPVDLDDPHLLARDGLGPSESDPQFHQQMVYAVAMLTIRQFERALGRVALWADRRIQKKDGTYVDQFVRRLRIYPHALRDRNAYYSPPRKALLFGYFTVTSKDAYNTPGTLVFTCLSHDIVAHETTHALLDGVHPRFNEATNPDVRAFHEAFADIVALFQHFSRKELVEQALAESHGDVNSDLLFDLGRQFGEATNGEIGGALRRALLRKEGPDSKIEPEHMYGDLKPREAHDRGSILVAAVFEAYLAAYRRRTEKLLRVVYASKPRSARDLPTEVIELLAEAAQNVAGHFLRICIRAIDYCPPIDVKFGTYLRALITADMDAVPDDKWGYRDAFIRAFRRRNISIRSVRDLSQDSLRWRAPDMTDRRIEALSFKALRFTDNGLNQPTPHEVKRRAEALGRFIVGDPERLRVFGVHAPGGAYGPITIQSIRLAHRIGPDDIPRNDLVAEVTQERRAKGNVFVGGATVIVGMDGDVRYVVRRRVDDLRRRHDEMTHAGPAGARNLQLRKIHAGRFGGK